MHQYLIAVGLHWLPNWQNRCCHASCELCSNYLSVNSWDVALLSILNIILVMKFKWEVDIVKFVWSSKCFNH